MLQMLGGLELMGEVNFVMGGLSFKTLGKYQ